VVTFPSPLEKANFVSSKGSLGLGFPGNLSAEELSQSNLSPCRQKEVSVLLEFNFGHLRYFLTDLPPQQRSPSERNVGGIQTNSSFPFHSLENERGKLLFLSFSAFRTHFTNFFLVGPVLRFFRNCCYSQLPKPSKEPPTNCCITAF